METDPWAGLGTPMVFLGFGMKLPTGYHDTFDRERWDFDRSKAITGEPSITDGIVPSSFQLGTGTLDPLLGLTCLQRIWRFTLSVGFMYQFSGGQNTVGYERSERLSWSVNAKFGFSGLFRFLDDVKPSVRCGFSGVDPQGRDIDHSENTRLLGSQERGLVDGTGRSYTFFDLGLDASFLEHFSGGAVLRIPVTASGDSENSFRFQFGFTAGAKF